MPCEILVSHRVNNVIDADANAERGILFRILRIVGVFPGIAQIHVVADGHHQASAVVVDSAPARLEAVELVDAAGAEELRARHLIAVVEIVKGMENLIRVLNIDNGAVRKYARHAGFEDFPFGRAMEIVAHEKSAAQQILAHLGSLLLGEIPMPDFDAIKPRPVEYFIAIVEIHRLLDRARVNARQAAQRCREMPVRARVIHGPARGALPPVAAPTPTAVSTDIAGERRVHEPRKSPFGLFLVVLRYLEPFVLKAGIFAERPLKRGEGAEQQDTRKHGEKSVPRTHLPPKSQNSR